MKGLVIQLSADAAHSLRHHGSQQQQFGAAEEEEDWNDVIPLGPSSTSQPASTTTNVEVEDAASLLVDDDAVREGDKAAAAAAAEEEEDESRASDEEEEDDDDLESVLSRAPPPSLPTLLVDLERLVGYAPRDADEVQRLSDEVATALGTTGDEDFEARVAEMLGSGIARHAAATTTAAVADNEAASDLRYANVPYPKAMILPDGGRNTVVTTARLWKRLIKPYRLDVVNRLLLLLAECGRPLTWKASMRREVLLMARDEERRVEMAEHEFHRSDQLRKLYGVRDTIENQRDLTSCRVQELERVRDEVVKQRLALQRLGGIGIESEGDAIDLGFDFLSRGDEKHDQEEAIALSSDYGDDLESDDEFDVVEGEDSRSDASEAADLVSDDDGSQHGDSPSRQSTMGSTQASTATEIQDRRFRPRRLQLTTRRAARLQQEKLDRASIEAAEAARARREKEIMQQACTTQELASMQAVLHALERKLQQVDELLETLQDEEWKKEEEREERGYSDDEDSQQEELVKDPLQAQKQLSLLDEILAMILGATPPPLDSPSMDDHVAWMRNEHREIVRGWKEYFGRLPPPLRRDVDQGSVAAQAISSNVTGTNTTSESTGRLDPGFHDNESNTTPEDDKALKERLKQAFGIEDKDVDHWEEGADDDVNAREEPLKAPGLRPQRGRRSRR
jgi:hypothetical protein